MSAHTRRLHEQRTNGQPHEPPQISDDPELLDAYRALQLHWLATVPGYREEIKARLSRERKRIAEIEGRIERHRQRDLDRLGREIDPCG